MMINLKSSMGLRECVWSDESHQCGTCIYIMYHCTLFIRACSVSQIQEVLPIRMTKKEISILGPERQCCKTISFFQGWMKALASFEITPRLVALYLNKESLNLDCYTMLTA